MGKELKQHPLNAPGKYYIDQDCCTFSGACVDAAPEYFKMDEEYMVYVIKQPDTPEEEACCRSAMECCPVEAIHNDGKI